MMWPYSQLRDNLKNDSFAPPAILINATFRVRKSTVVPLVPNRSTIATRSHPKGKINFFNNRPKLNQKFSLKKIFKIHVYIYFETSFTDFLYFYIKCFVI